MPPFAGLLNPRSRCTRGELSWSPERDDATSTRDEEIDVLRFHSAMPRHACRRRRRRRGASCSPATVLARHGPVSALNERPSSPAEQGSRRAARTNGVDERCCFKPLSKRSQLYTHGLTATRGNFESTPPLPPHSGSEFASTSRPIGCPNHRI